MRDKEGRKMSKSLGNGVDPLEFIDAVRRRYAAFYRCSTGVASRSDDIRFSDDKAEKHAATL